MYELIGFRDGDYVSKKTGNPVYGIRLYVTYDAKNVTGICCAEIFVSKNVISMDELKVGSLYNILYNRFGSVESVIEVN